MLRYGDKVRLTGPERALLEQAAGSSADCNTASALNDKVTQAAEMLRDEADATEPDVDADGVDHSGAPELRLLAALVESLKPGA